MGKAVGLVQGNFGMPAGMLPQAGYPCPGHLRHAGHTGQVKPAQRPAYRREGPVWARRLPLPRAPSACRPDPLGQGSYPCPGHLRHAGQTRLGKAVTLAQGNFGMPASKAQPCLPNRVFFVRKADIWRQNCQNEVKFRLSTIVFGVFTDQIDRRGDRRSNRRRDLGPGV